MMNNKTTKTPNHSQQHSHQDQPEINMDILNTMNQKYNFKIKQIRPDLVLIDSGSLDEWMVEIMPKHKNNPANIYLYHKNNRHDTSKEHLQRKFYDYKWLLGFIKSHNEKPLVDKGYKPNKNKNKSKRRKVTC